MKSQKHFLFILIAPLDLNIGSFRTLKPLQLIISLHAKFREMCFYFYEQRFYVFA